MCRTRAFVRNYTRWMLHLGCDLNANHTLISLSINRRAIEMITIIVAVCIGSFPYRQFSACVRNPTMHHVRAVHCVVIVWEREKYKRNAFGKFSIRRNASVRQTESDFVLFFASFRTHTRIHITRMHYPIQCVPNVRSMIILKWKNWRKKSNISHRRHMIECAHVRCLYRRIDKIPPL